MSWKPTKEEVKVATEYYKAREEEDRKALHCGNRANGSWLQSIKSSIARHKQDRMAEREMEKEERKAKRARHEREKRKQEEIFSGMFGSVLKVAAEVKNGRGKEVVKQKKQCKVPEKEAGKDQMYEKTALGDCIAKDIRQQSQRRNRLAREKQETLKQQHAEKTRRHEDYLRALVMKEKREKHIRNGN
ncbi:MAG: hypothetical protein M1828_004572 [Chrysothrix sp. TS-e1954]|nr:MAG: hypothetical protein M1828_004572 [Chrysothrix sp. TS-e1954]